MQERGCLFLSCGLSSSWPVNEVPDTLVQDSMHDALKVEGLRVTG